MSRPDSKLIERRFKEDLALWVESAREPCFFLKACLENDLRGAFERGDDAALDNLPHVVSYLYNEIPALAWGSPAKVRAWAAIGGLRDKEAVSR